tara:strand:- start:10181 stop:10498 length:318 start_codon:yes stop_codon:yes gene_type:complete
MAKLSNNRLIEQIIKRLKNNKIKKNAIIHIFNPYGTGDWFLSQIDEDGIAFGLCDLGYAELGYVSISELESIKIKVGKYEFPLEVDRHFTPIDLQLLATQKREGR